MGLSHPDFSFGVSGKVWLGLFVEIVVVALARALAFCAQGREWSSIADYRRLSKIFCILYLLQHKLGQICTRYPQPHLALAKIADSDFS